MTDNKIILICAAILLLAIGFFAGCKWAASSSQPRFIEIHEPTPIVSSSTAGQTAMENETLSLSPAAYNSTAGVITEIQSDSIIIQEFETFPKYADRNARRLTVLFTTETKTLINDSTISWTGLEGLKHLQAGKSVVIESLGNIKGKAEFQAKTIRLMN